MTAIEISQRKHNTTSHPKPELPVSLQCQSLVPTPKPTCPALYRFNSAGTTKILALSRGKFLFLPLTLFKAALAKYQSSAIRVTLKVRVAHAVTRGSGLGIVVCLSSTYDWLASEEDAVVSYDSS